VQLTDETAPRRAGWAEMELEGRGIRARKAPEEGYERAWRQDGKRPRTREGPWRRVDQEQCRQPSVKTKAFVTINIYVHTHICFGIHTERKVLLLER